jgi:hypothetical protein
MRIWGFAILVAAAFAAGAALAQAPQARPNASPTPIAVNPAPIAASPAPSATAEFGFVFMPTPSPQTTPFPAPHQPQILEIDLSEQTLTTPGRLRVRVLTNDEVSTVVARTMGYELPIPKVRPGSFAAAYDVPAAPGFLSRRTFDVDFVAAVPDGRISTITLQLGLK